MKNYLINLLKRAIFPHILILILGNMVSVVLLTFVFEHQLQHCTFAYFGYVVSAYTLTINVAVVLSKMKILKKHLYKNRFVHKYHTDLAFKAEISLYVSLGVNLVYSCFKVFAGVYYHSIWFGTVAFYYIILCVVRFLLLNHIQRKNQNYQLEIRRYCLCGYLLFVLTIFITRMSIYMIHEGKSSIYPTYFIYIVASYTFYSFTIAIINIVRYRKTDNLMYHASKMIALATAFVSVFSLQTAMFAEFGKDYGQQRMMNILTGAVIFVIVTGIAIYMIIRGKTLSIQKDK